MLNLLTDMKNILNRREHCSDSVSSVGLAFFGTLMCCAFSCDFLALYLMWFNDVMNGWVWLWLLRVPHSQSFCSHCKFIDSRHAIPQGHPILMKQLKEDKRCVSETHDEVGMNDLHGCCLFRCLFRCLGTEHSNFFFDETKDLHQIDRISALFLKNIL